MEPFEERPPEPPAPPRPAGDSVHLEAHASDDAIINQAARDLHLHYQDGVRGARRAESGTEVGECPYPGLASFGREQARWFFGRDELTAELIARLDGRLRAGGVQVVVAPSGAGKSSLLHAGLLPQLASGALPGSSRWPTMVFTPTAHPLVALATQIAALTGADPATLAEEFAADSRRCVEALRDHIGPQGPGARVLVVVDQFEELFTLCADGQDRRTFIELLAQLASPRSGSEDQRPVGLVVVGVRADFYAACANDPHLRAALQDNPLVVGPMSDTELRQAILYPARNVGLDVEPGLVELLLRDLGDTAPVPDERGMTGYEAGRLPLLAHALRATWQQRHGHVLTVRGYRSTGGIHRAVATTADRIFTSLDPAGQHAARTLFLRLIKVGDGTEDTRRRVARTHLLRGLNPDNALPVVDAFTQGRLLTQDQDTVEVTHEALVRAWPRLRQWIDTDRAGNLIRQELDDAATVWDRDHRDTGSLYRGNRLEAARTWATSTTHESGDLSPAASAFLAASTAQEHRAIRLRRVALVVLSVLALVTSGTAIIARQQTGIAQRERDIAIVNQLTTEADQLRDTDVSLATQLDLTAYRVRPTPDLYTSLVTADNAFLSTPLTGHTSFVGPVVFSPDGRTLASGSGDHTVRLWDLTDRAHPTPLGQPLTGHTDLVTSVVFSPDGRTLATGSSDHTVRLWNMPYAPLTGHTAAVSAVVFNPDGRTLATGSFDHTVRLWNVADPAHPTPLGQPLTAHTAAVAAVVFSPNGRTLATGSIDGTVRLWTVADPTHPLLLGQPLTGDVSIVEPVMFSPDGRTLATGSGYQTVRLWNVADPAHPTPLGQLSVGGTFFILSVVFSPDGRTLATGSVDGTVRLWTVADPAHPLLLGQPLTGNVGIVEPVVFSPDGRILVAGSSDHTVRLWNVADPAHPTPLGQPLIGHTDTVTAVVFSPDGRTLATGSSDHTVRLWEMNIDRAIQRICATTTNTLTPAKWQQYVSPDLPYHPPCP